MLIQQLRELEQQGIVSRKMYPGVPPKVEYAITNFGRSLGKALLPLAEWGASNEDRVFADKNLQ